MGSEKFWNCWVEGTNGGYHNKHATFDDAKAESERLLKQPRNQDKKVFVMECVAYCEIPVPEPPIKWKIPD